MLPVEEASKFPDKASHGKRDYVSTLDSEMSMLLRKGDGTFETAPQ